LHQRIASRAAGLGGLLAPRSPRQVNKITTENKAARTATESLQEAAKDPEWVPLITHRIAEGQTAEEINNEIYWIDRYAWARRKGYSLAGCLKYHWPW